MGVSREDLAGGVEDVEGGKGGEKAEGGAEQRRKRNG